MDSNHPQADHDINIAKAEAQLSSLHSLHSLQSRDILSANANANTTDVSHFKDGSNFASHEITGMMQMPRRESIGFANPLSDSMFARRSSLGLGGDGFSMDMSTGLVGGGMMARRGSMDSVYDAAMQNLANRRLSMMGGSTHAAMNANANNTNSTLLNSGGMGMSPSLMGMQPQGMNNSLGFNMNGSGSGGMSPMNQFLMHQLGLTQAMTGGTNPSTFNAGGTAANDAAMALNTSLNSNLGANTLRQKQLNEQRLELQRKQKELELQRQQLLSAMEERQQAMKEMQKSIQHGGISGQNQPHVPFERRHSLFGGKVGALEGPEMEAAASSGEHDRSTTLSNAGTGTNFFVCKFCNAKAFTNADQAIACENACKTRLENEWRRNNGVHRDERRGSLDLLGALAGVTQEVESKQGSINKMSTSNSASSQNSVSDHSHHSSGPMNKTQSHGGFTLMKKPIPLGLPADKDWLTPLHCFVRLHCVEVFTASKIDVAIPTKGKRKPIQIGQVGIRCPHCHSSEIGPVHRERGSVYYPTSVSSIYNATMNLLQRHLHNCTSVKPDIMQRYETLKSDDARSGTSKKYWAESARSLGLVDTPEGIRFSSSEPPPLPSLTSEQKASDNYSAVRGNDDSFFNSDSNALVEGESHGKSDAFKDSIKREECGGVFRSSKDHEGTDAVDEFSNIPGTTIEEKAILNNMRLAEQRLSTSAPLVTREDEKVATQFSYYLLRQMQMCVFTEADRLGKRKGLPPGFPGLACRHCFGGYGSGRFFPSSIKTLSDTSKTLNVLKNHMMRCRKCPTEVRETLMKLRKTHDEERAKMKFGSQKAFFARIWDRLHDNDPTVDARKRKFNQPKKPKPAPAASVPVSVQNVTAAENLMNMHMSGANFGQQSRPSYLDAANAFTGGLGGLPTAGLFSVGGMVSGNNTFNPTTSHFITGDSETNKRLKLQNYSHSNTSI